MLIPSRLGPGVINTHYRRPHLLSNQPHLVGGEAIHHAAVVDVALPDDDIRHGYLYPLPAMS